MLKIAHRGASAHAPENTMLAFRKGFELGADALELDVHLCKSGEVVVIHDADVKRTTGDKGKVANLTLKELQQLDAGQGETIPTLDMVLKAFAEHYVIFTEIKAAAAAIPAAKLVASHAKRGVPYAHMPMIGFKQKSLDAIHAFNPDIIVGISPDDRFPINPKFYARAKVKGMSSINPSIRQLTKKLVDQAHAHELKIFTWTANTPASIAKAKALGVDGIISNFPERL